MRNSFNTMGSLGEFFPDKDVPCKNRKCRNTWTWTQKQQGGRVTPPKRFCQSCFEKVQQLEDQHVPCSEPDCEHTWLWTRDQQLISGLDPANPPKQRCLECQKKIAEEAEDKEMPCRIRECKKTWTWFKADQARHGRKKAPDRLCPDCFDKMKGLSDRTVSCRVEKCEGTWVYHRISQLADQLGGKPADYTPKRMCENCYKELKAYKEREVPCKIKECNHTWKFTAYSQLEYFTRVGKDAPDPERMCDQCFKFMNEAGEEEINCRNKGCDNTWHYSKSMKLHDHLVKRRHPHYRMCSTCYEKVKAMDARKMPCRHDGCHNTWEWSPQEQLQHQLLERERDPEKPCTECSDFLRDTEPVDRPCTGCSKTMKVTAYQQLMEKLGTFHGSGLCPDCNKNQLDSSQSGQSLSITHHSHVISLPHKGAWSQDRALQELPPRITPQLLKSVQDSDVVVLVYTDQLGLSAESEGWPELVQKELTAKYPELKTTLINAAISGTTSAQAVARMARDLAPYQPDLIIYSFEQGNLKLADSKEGIEPINTLAAAIGELGKPSVYLTCPMLPGEVSGSETDRLSYFTRMSAHAKSMAEKNGSKILDIRAMFEVTGRESAAKWMKSRFEANEKGSNMIAHWVADQITKLEVYN